MKKQYRKSMKYKDNYLKINKTYKPSTQAIKEKRDNTNYCYYKWKRRCNYRS